MEVEILNRATVKSERTKPPTIQIFEKGQVRFSVGAHKLLGLLPGDKLELILDHKDKHIIYFRKADNGFELKAEKTPQGQIRLLLLCRPLAKKLFQFFGLKESTTYDITADLADYYGSMCWFILKEKKHQPIKYR